MNNIIILGAGESGLGSALLAKRKKYDVFVSDSSEISGQVKNKLVESGIDFEEFPLGLTGTTCILYSDSQAVV